MREALGRALRAALAISLASSAILGASEKNAAPPLTHEHRHPSGAFSFKTPESWTEETFPSEPGVLQVAGDQMVVRFVFQRGEAGYDAFHGLCMTQRLPGAPQTDPWIEFEYDYLSGGLADRRFLDSAFRVRYDAPIQGHREWRQRNLTVVGAAESLCIIAFVPSQVWKKSKASRALADAVVRSVGFR